MGYQVIWVLITRMLSIIKELTNSRTTKMRLLQFIIFVFFLEFNLILFMPSYGQKIVESRFMAITHLKPIPLLTDFHLKVRQLPSGIAGGLYGSVQKMVCVVLMATLSKFLITSPLTVLPSVIIL